MHYKIIILSFLLFSCDSITSNDPYPGVDCNIDNCCSPFLYSYTPHTLRYLCNEFGVCQDGVIDGYEQLSWNFVSHFKNGYPYGETILDTDDYISSISSFDPVYVPNYIDFCNKTYKPWIGYDMEDQSIYLDSEYSEYSRCYDSNGRNYDPSLTYEENIEIGYLGHAWIDMLHDGFGPADVFDAHCDPYANYNCLVDTEWNSSGLSGLVDIGHPNADLLPGVDYSTHNANGRCDDYELNCLLIDFEGVLVNGEYLYNAPDNITRFDIPYDRHQNSQLEFNFTDPEYGQYNMFGGIDKTMPQNIICDWIIY